MKETQNQTRFNGVGAVKTVPVCLTPELRTRIDEAAREQGISRSAMTRLLISKGLSSGQNNRPKGDTHP